MTKDETWVNSDDHLKCTNVRSKRRDLSCNNFIINLQKVSE